MAAAQIGGRAALAQEIDVGRRRAARHPAGWLLVEAETGRAGRTYPGRLLDTSAGGLGLVLDDEIAAGTLVRISPTSTGATPEHPFWRGRLARVAYALPLPGGSWRVGLTFAAGTAGALHIWATRLLLLAVFTIAAISALYSDPAGATAGTALGALAVVLAIGAERQHWLDTRSFRRAQS